jgi:hypothetical protein
MNSPNVNTAAYRENGPHAEESLFQNPAGFERVQVSEKLL